MNFYYLGPSAEADGNEDAVCILERENIISNGFITGYIIFF